MAGRHAQRSRARIRRRQSTAPPSGRRGRHRRPPGRLARSARRVVSIAVVPVVLAGGTAAYAYWSASGSGSATVGTTTAAAIGVSASATPPPGLYPGRTVDLSVALSNSNSYPVSLTTLTAVTISSSDPAGCPSSTITLPSDVTTGLAGSGYPLPSPFAVPAGGQGTGTLSGLITLSTSAPDACQGKTFTVSLSFTGSQV